MSGTQSESQLVELNVGGVFYSTSLSTLTSESGSKLDQMFNNQDSILKDSKVWLLFEPVIWEPLFDFVSDFSYTRANIS